MDRATHLEVLLLFPQILHFSLTSGHSLAEVGHELDRPA